MVTERTKMHDKKGSGRRPEKEPQAGFTLVEVIIAIVVLAFGLLGLAGTTALVVRQVNLAEIATERSLVTQSTLERIQALPYDSVVDGSDVMGSFQVSWTVVAPTNQWKALELITTGPGMSLSSSGYPILVNTVADTITHRILRP
jgi:prepilin-type N-terminal cleavage/methylation domain-containing protein